MIPLLQGAGPFETLLPTRAAHPGWRGMRTRTLLSAELSSAFRIISLRSAGKRMIVRSADRSPEHNRAVGGAKASKHLEGTAFDIAMANHDPRGAREGGAPFGFRRFGFCRDSGLSTSTWASAGPRRRFPQHPSGFRNGDAAGREVLANAGR